MKKVLFIICILIISIGCKKSKHEIETNNVLKELKLDNNKPWQVNEATHIGVTKMDSLIKGFKNSKSNDFTILGEFLSKQTSYIIKNCDMKGEPHDQLHVVLVPMLDEISLLRDNIENKSKKDALLRLEIYIKKYFEYFKK
jgi:hypothetical protein